MVKCLLEVFVWGVVLVVCVCRGCCSLSVCVCVCVCDLLIFSQDVVDAALFELGEWLIHTSRSQDVVDAALFEPGEWLPPGGISSISEAPVADRALLATPCGLLLNELVHAPAATLRPIEAMLELAQVFSLYKIFVHSKASLHSSIILVLPPPTCFAHTIAILSYDFCAIYDPPTTTLLYAIHHTIVVMAISCKDQAGVHADALKKGPGDAVFLSTSSS